MWRMQAEAAKRRAALAEIARKQRAANAQKRNARVERKGQAPATTAPRRLPSAAPVRNSANEADGSFMIQLGSFGDAANAQRLKRELDKAGYRCVLQQLTISGKPVTRVLVGPIRGRSEADRIRERLATQTQLRAIVVSSS